MRLPGHVNVVFQDQQWYKKEARNPYQNSVIADLGKVSNAASARCFLWYREANCVACVKTLVSLLIWAIFYP